MGDKVHTPEATIMIDAADKTSVKIIDQPAEWPEINTRAK